MEVKKQINRRRNIWVVNQYAVPTSLPGITRHFELFNEILKTSSVDVTFWLSSFNYSLRRFLSKTKKREIENENPGIKLRWGWAFPHQRNNWKRIVNMLSFAIGFFFKSFFSKKPDIIFASSPQIFVAFSALLISKIFKIRFVLEIRDLWPESLVVMKGNNDGIILKILYKLEKALYRGASHIIVLAEHQRKHIIDKGINPRHITLIPNGIIVDEFVRPTREDIRERKEKLGLPSDSFVAIYTGAHGTANSLDQLVFAGQYLAKDEYIVLIGDGPEKDRLVALKGSKSIDQVLFFDPLPKTEILKYTAIADCGIISLSDNIVFRGARPNKLFDYMALGIPIISTIGGEVEHILETNNVGKCVQSNNYQMLANAIQEVRLLSKERKEEIKNNGWSYILSEGNRTEAARKLAEIINS